ncbi:hypothetical protein BDZ89DRAFT_968546, partial [Hymenopellis radicata]
MFISSVYSVGYQEPCTPFKAMIKLKDGEGGEGLVKAFFDDGAMVAAMDTKVYEQLKPQLGGWIPTQRVLRVASGELIPAITAWKGTINLRGVEVTGCFEVFDSGGSWDFLFGKPLIEAFRAIHDYEEDIVYIRPAG